jgi:hypothetical protein
VTIATRSPKISKMSQQSQMKPSGDE